MIIQYLLFFFFCFPLSTSFPVDMKWDHPLYPNEQKTSAILVGFQVTWAIHGEKWGLMDLKMYTGRYNNTWPKLDHYLFTSPFLHRCHHKMVSKCICWVTMMENAEVFFVNNAHHTLGPPGRATTRSLSFLVGNSYKHSLLAVTGWGSIKRWPPLSGITWCQFEEVGLFSNNHGY